MAQNTKSNYLCFSLITVFLSALFVLPTVHGQANIPDSLTPVISFLLSEENECPEVTSETTFQGLASISTQSQLDSILTGITHIEGNLSFNTVNSGIVNPQSLDFSAADSLVSISGSLSFTDIEIENISGFDCLTSVGSNMLVGASSFMNDFRDTPPRTPNLRTVSGFKSLKTIGGYLEIRRNEALEILPDFLSLESIGGVLNDEGFFDPVGAYLLISVNPLLIKGPEFPLLKRAGNLISYRDNDSIIEIPEFSSLEEIPFIEIIDNGQLMRVSNFPLVKRLRGLDISDNDSLIEAPDFPVVESLFGDYTISGSSLTSLPEFPLLKSIDGSLNIDQSSNLENLPIFFSSLEGIGGRLHIVRNDGITNLVEFSSLETIGNNLEILNNNGLIGLSEFPMLKTIGRNLVIEDMGNLTSLPDFPSLENIESIRIQSNPNLTNISGFESLQSARNIIVSSNSNLNQISGFNSLETARLINISLNNLSGFTEVDGFTSLDSLSQSLILGDNVTLLCENSPNPPLFLCENDD